jgi:hypothetical protein
VFVEAVLAELDGGSAMAAIRCRIFRQAELSGPLGHRRVSLTPNHAEVVMNPCFHTVCNTSATRAAPSIRLRFFVAQI